MASFVSRYLDRVAQTKSVLCVGLDPTPEHVPPDFSKGGGDPLDCMKRYLQEVIIRAAPAVPVVKPQVAYYSALGDAGLRMLRDLIEFAHAEGLLVILDAKRADIGETMVQYGIEAFGYYKADACTFVPYLGPTFNPSWKEGLSQGRMAISMIRTSNPEAALLQDAMLDNGLRVYEQVAAWVNGWNADIQKLTEGAGNVGGVVGATWPEQAPRCRELAGDKVFFLIPGYGAQGGGSDGAVGGLPNSQGKLMGVVNSSRGITLTSWFNKEKKEPREGDPLELVTKAIADSNADLNGALVRKLGKPIEKIFSNVA